MLKKTITYKDLDDNEFIEDFYFHMSHADLAEMELSHSGGLAAYLTSIIKSDDRSAIIKTFKMIISASIGRRSEDGKRFEKSEQISNEFLQTNAYSVLFMELVTDASAGAEFIIGVVPKDISGKIDIAEVMKGGVAHLPDTTDVEITAPVKAEGEAVDPTGPPKKLEDYSFPELEEMPLEELKALLAGVKGNVSKGILSIAMRRSAAGQ